MRIKYLIFPFLFQILSRLALRPIAKFFLRYEVRGLENLKKINGNCLFVSNHIHEIDPVLFLMTLPIFAFARPMFFVSSPKEAYNHKGWRAKLFYGGLLFHSFGARESYRGLDDYALSVKHHIKLLLEGQSVLIFPEGRYTRDGNIGHTGGGASYLAYTTKKPVLPIKLEGIWDMSFKEFFNRKRKFVVTIGEPLFYEDLFNDNFNQSREGFKQKSGEIIRRV